MQTNTSRRIVQPLDVDDTWSLPLQCLLSAQSLFFPTAPVCQCTSDVFVFNIVFTSPFPTFPLAWYRPYIVFSAYNSFVTLKRFTAGRVHTCEYAAHYCYNVGARSCGQERLQLSPPPITQPGTPPQCARACTRPHSLRIFVCVCATVCVFVHTVSVRMFVCVCVVPTRPWG